MKIFLRVGSSTYSARRKIYIENWDRFWSSEWPGLLLTLNACFSGQMLTRPSQRSLPQITQQQREPAEEDLDFESVIMASKRAHQSRNVFEDSISSYKQNATKVAPRPVAPRPVQQPRMRQPEPNQTPQTINRPDPEQTVRNIVEQRQKLEEMFGKPGKQICNAACRFLVWNLHCYNLPEPKKKNTSAPKKNVGKLKMKRYAPALNNNNASQEQQPKPKPRNTQKPAMRQMQQQQQISEDLDIDPGDLEIHVWEHWEASIFHCWECSDVQYTASIRPAV